MYCLAGIPVAVPQNGQPFSYNRAIKETQKGAKKHENTGTSDLKYRHS